MDATERALATAAVYILILMSCFIGYMLYAVTRVHRNRVNLQQQFLLEQTTVVEEERRRIAHDLHDQVSPQLWLALMHLEVEISQAESPSEYLISAKTHLEKSLFLVETIAVQLLPLSDLEKGLCKALEELFVSAKSFFPKQVFTLACRLHSEITSSKSLHLYRIVQEVLWNAVKHADCSRVDVVLNERKGRLYLQCRDDGEGFDVDEALRQNRVGIRSLRRRTEVLGGTMRCRSGNGKGTEYFFSFPV